MRLLAMFHAYPPTHNAGAEWMAHTMLRHLVRVGHDVDVVLSTGTGADWELDGVRVHARRDKGDPIRLIHDLRPSVMVTHLENTSRASVLAWQAQVPVVHLLHNTFWPTKLWAYKHRPALLVANSEWMAADYREFLAGRNVRDQRIVTVRPPVDGEDYRTKPGDRVTLVNLFANKGPHVLWELAERMPDVGFLAVRGGYGEQVIPNRVPPNVDIVDNTPRMRDEVYARTRILLMPSDYESWGRVGVEAMHSGIPVIAHPTPGLNESLESAGTFVDRAEVDGWERAVRDLLKPKRWAAASRKAKARAAELDPAADLARWTAAVESLAPAAARSHRMPTDPKAKKPSGNVVVARAQTAAAGGAA